MDATWPAGVAGRMRRWLTHLPAQSRLAGLVLGTPRVPPAGAETRPVASDETEKRWPSYALSLGLVALVTIAGFWIEQTIARTNQAMLYLFCVLVSALRWGRGPAVTVAFAGAVAFDFFFIPPYRSFVLPDTWYLITFLALLIVGLVTSALASEARAQAAAARKREAHTAALHLLAQSLSEAAGMDEVLSAIERHVQHALGQPIAVFLPSPAGLALRLRSAALAVTDAVEATAQRVFEQGGSGEAGGVQCQALRTWRGTVGVLAVRSAEPSGRRPGEHSRLLEAFANQAALAISRALLEEEAQRGRLLQETDRLQRALLNSISHNLRTPLASITGTLTTLAEEADVMRESLQRELLDTALGEAERLNRLVTNLLDMTRLEAAATRVRREPCDLQDLIGAAVAQLGKPARERPIEIDAPERLPLVSLDFVLIAQVLVNLLDNALKYSGPDQPVRVEARVEGGRAMLRVIDRGAGIPEEFRDKVFEKFNRGVRAGESGGAGLGLSICRGFVEAHGGRIWIEPASPAGCAAVFTLPLEAPD